MEDDDTFPAWSENATKGDLIRAILYLRSAVTSLAGVVVAMRTDNEEGVESRMSSYFEKNEELDRIMAEIAGRES